MAFVKGPAMAPTFTRLHPHFVAEVSPVDLRQVDDKATLGAIRSALDEHAVLVFRDQTFRDDEQLKFAQRLDGNVNFNSTTAAILGKSRLPYEGMIDVSNVTHDGKVWDANDKKRMSRMSNRLWHTDASFQDPAGRYSMLWARTVPPTSAPTEFADMRAAYDALDDEMKATLETVRAFHTPLSVKRILGFDVGLSEEDKNKLHSAVHPLIRTIPNTNRRSLYVATHISHFIDWPVPESRMVLQELIEHATQRQFVFRHEWRVGDLVVWDNRATMHRRPPFDDLKYPRELVRVTTLDYPMADSHPSAARAV